MSEFDIAPRNFPIPPTLWVRVETAVYGKGDNIILNSTTMFFRLNSGGTNVVNQSEPGTIGEAGTVSGSLVPMVPLDKHLMFHLRHSTETCLLCLHTQT